MPSTPPTVPGAPAPTVASVRDDFNRTTLGSNWAVTTKISNYGTLITDGKNAKFDMPAFDGFLVDARRNVFAATYSGVNSLSVYQKVYMTLGTAPGVPAIGPPGYNDLIGRAKSGVICLVARFYNDAARTVRLFWRNGAYEADPFAPSNTFATFARPSTSSLTAGTNLEFIVGSRAASDASRCSVRIGSWTSPVYTSTAALSVLGNGWGFGGGNGNSSTSVQWPGTVDSWGAEDQQ